MNQEEQYKYVREKVKEAYNLKYGLRKEERLQLITEIGLQGLVLFEYYLRLASIEEAKITDEGAAEYFGWNIHTARRYRRELTNHGWVHTEKARLSNGHVIIVYYLGKEEVSRAKANLFRVEQLEKG